MKFNNQRLNITNMAQIGCNVQIEDNTNIYDNAFKVDD